MIPAAPGASARVCARVPAGVSACRIGTAGRRLASVAYAATVCVTAASATAPAAVGHAAVARARLTACTRCPARIGIGATVNQ